MTLRDRILRLSATLAVAVPYSVVAAVTPVHATGAVDCSYLMNAGFSPALTTATVSLGTASMSMDGPCVLAHVEPTSGTPLPYEESGGYDAPIPVNRNVSWSGSCVKADITAPYWYTGGLLVGGSVLVSESVANQSVEVEVLDPLLAPCLETEAVGAGTAFLTD